MSVGMRIQYVRAKLAGVIQSCPTRKRLIIIKYCLPNPAYHLEAQGESPLARSGPGVNNFGKVAGSARDRVRRRPELLTPRRPAEDQGGGRGHAFRDGKARQNNLRSSATAGYAELPSRATAAATPSQDQVLRHIGNGSTVYLVWNDSEVVSRVMPEQG